MRDTEAAGTVHGGLAGLAGLLGGVIIGLAYLVLPAGKIPGGDPLIASHLGDTTGLTGSSSLTLLSVVPFLAAVIVGIGGWLSVAKPVDSAGRVGGLALLGCAALATVTYVLPLVHVMTAMGFPLGISSIGFTGSGFWVTLLGILVTAGGGWLQLSDSRASRA